VLDAPAVVEHVLYAAHQIPQFARARLQPLGHPR
jgi:hypothetical protein